VPTLLTCTLPICKFAFREIFCWNVVFANYFTVEVMHLVIFTGLLRIITV
jgi:hypothetical protein